MQYVPARRAHASRAPSSSTSRDSSWSFATGAVETIDCEQYPQSSGQMPLFAFTSMFSLTLPPKCARPVGDRPEPRTRDDEDRQLQVAREVADRPTLADGNEQSARALDERRVVPGCDRPHVRDRLLPVDGPVFQLGGGERSKRRG